MKRSVLLIVAFLVVVSFVLGGCSRYMEAIAPTPTAVVSAEPSPPSIPTFTPAPTATAEPTATATATETLVPSPTSYDTATPMPSDTPTSDSELEGAEPATATPEMALESPLEGEALQGKPLQGRLAFQEASGGNIYLINADGTGLRLLTNGMDPALSPDGASLAFVRWDKDKGIYLMGLDGGEPRMIWGEEHPRGPAWSPDGSRIAYTSKYLAWIPPVGFNIPGYGFLEIFPGRDEDRWNLHIIDLSDGRTFDPRFDRHGFSPSWGSDGETIVYDGDRGLRLVTGDEEPRSLTDDIWDSSPVWSPDGSRIAYMYKQHDHWEIYTVRPDGSDWRRLTKEPLFSDNPPNNVAPAWSPDGEHIVFLSDRNGGWELFVMGADGSDQREMFPAGLDGIRFRYEFAAERVVSWAR